MTIGREKEREAVRQCFLFSNHLIITSRTQGGKLHLVDIVGKIPLADITLLEDPNEEERTDDQGNNTLFDYIQLVQGNIEFKVWLFLFSIAMDLQNGDVDQELPFLSSRIAQELLELAFCVLLSM